MQSLLVLLNILLLYVTTSQLTASCREKIALGAKGLAQSEKSDPIKETKRLLKAASKGNERVIVQLLTQDPSIIDAPASDGATALCKAIQGGHLKAVETLLDKGAKVNVGANDGRTPAHYAVASGDTNTLALLLDRGASIDAPDKSGITPLMVAAGYAFNMNRPNYNGHTNTALLLLARKAKLNLADELGSTALHKAASNGHASIVTALLSHQADIAAKTKLGTTAFTLAVWYNGDPEVSILLFAHGGADRESCNLILRECVKEIRDCRYQAIAQRIIVHGTLINLLSNGLSENIKTLLQHIGAKLKQHTRKDSAMKQASFSIDEGELTPNMLDAIIYDRLNRPGVQALLSSHNNPEAAQEYRTIVDNTRIFSDALSERLACLVKEKPFKEALKQHLKELTLEDSEMKKALKMTISPRKMLIPVASSLVLRYSISMALT